jgi:hypothetical protein
LCRNKHLRNNRDSPVGRWRKFRSPRTMCFRRKIAHALVPEGEAGMQAMCRRSRNERIERSGGDS